MGKSITVIKLGQDNKVDIFRNPPKTEMLFEQIQKDTIGKSGSNPTWGYTYQNQDGKLKFSGIALYKEYDYEYPMGAYGEKIWSIFGKELLSENVKVPEIELVEEEPGCEGLISYILINNDREDMLHIKDTLFNKFEREEMKSKKDIYTIDEILECVRLEIGNEENYKKIEKDIIQVLLLDAVTNNPDRHGLNWGLVRNEKTNEYSLAVFDHASSFVNMIEDKSHFVVRNWVNTYTTVGNDKGRHYLGSDGYKIVQYISKEYPEYFEEFCDKFNNKLPKILEKVEQENMKIDFFRLSTKMKEKNYYLKKLRNKGEYEYE